MMLRFTVLFVALASTLVSAEECVNNPEPFDLKKGKKIIPYQCDFLFVENAKKVRNKCKKKAISKNCPAICDINNKCECSVNYGEDFNTQGTGNISCEDVRDGDREKFCKKPPVQRFCAGLCNPDCGNEPAPSPTPQEPEPEDSSD